MIYSCYHCEKRAPGCHGHCADYREDRRRSLYVRRCVKAQEDADTYEMTNQYYRQKISGRRKIP